MISIIFNVVITTSGIGLVAYMIKNPEKIELWISLLCRFSRFCSKKAEYAYVKYNAQHAINAFLALMKKQMPNLLVKRVKIKWVDENITQEQFLDKGCLVMIMHKSNSQTRNVVNATFTFVSYSILRKVKRYLAKYQKNAIDLFVSNKILHNQGYELEQEFVDKYLFDGLNNDPKVKSLYGQFFDIDKAGLYFPVFLTEMAFLGDKIFAHGTDKNTVYEEVKELVSFLNLYSRRKTSEETQSEYTGNYSKFAIRIVGKQRKIDKHDISIYTNNLQRLDPSIETIYLVGSELNKKFIKNVIECFVKEKSYYIYNSYIYDASLFDSQGNPFISRSCLFVLRSMTQEFFQK